LPRLRFLGDVTGDLARVDHDFVRQKNEQLDARLVAEKANNVFRDHLFGDEMSAVELRKIVAPELRRSGNAVGKLVERLPAQLVIPRWERALLRRERFAGADFAQEIARRAERDLEKVRPQRLAQPVAARRHGELFEKLGRGNFLALPLIEKRLVGRRQFRPAEGDLLAAALQSLDDAPRGPAIGH
jgi:hypothetical protein